MTALLFGVNLPASAGPNDDPVRFALAAEALGFDFVSASDHPCGRGDSFETWTMLTWVAAATHRITVATRVLSLPFRSPALVAKMAESLDRLSGGRLILGLGAGAADAELEAFGLPVPSARQKVDGLADAMEIIGGLWSRPGFTYEGLAHHTKSADIEPKPRRHIPIWLGTFGDRALALTGRYADGWIPSLGYAPFDQLARMRSKVLEAAEGSGRAAQDITCALNVEVSVTEGHVDEGPDVISGPPSVVTDRLYTLAQMGFTAFNFMPQGLEPECQLGRIAEEVLPALRAMS